MNRNKTCLDTSYERQKYKENIDFIWHNKNTKLQKITELLKTKISRKMRVSIQKFNILKKQYSRNGKLQKGRRI